MIDPVDLARDRLDRDIARLLTGPGREAWLIYRAEGERLRRERERVRRSEDETREVPR
jgi:hypothetical protein